MPARGRAPSVEGMSAWTWQVPFSLVVGGIVFAVLLLPILLSQYRRFGRLSPVHLLLAFGMSVYAVALVAFTLLPLPVAAEVCRPGRSGGILQPYPFFTVVDIVHLMERWGPGSSRVVLGVLQVAMNVLLFIPLGLLLRGVARRSTLTSTLAGLGVSLVIEATQYTGNWGLYPCSYRIADIDDLMTNAAGALIGALLAPRLLSRWVPDPRELARMPALPVGAFRRLTGMVVDLLLFQAVALLPLIGWAVVEELAVMPAAGQSDVSEPALTTVGVLLAGLAVFALPALVGSGASLGQRLVSISPVWPAGRGSLRQRLARAGVVGGVFTLGIAVLVLLLDAGLVVIPLLLLLGWAMWMLVALVTALLGDHRGLSGLISGARMIDARPRAVAVARSRARSAALPATGEPANG